MQLSNRKMSFCSDLIGKKWEEVLRSSSREKGLVPQQDQKEEPGLTDSNSTTNMGSALF